MNHSKRDLFLTLGAGLALAWAVVGCELSIKQRPPLIQCPTVDLLVCGPKTLHLDVSGVTVEQRGHKAIVTLREDRSLIVRDERQPCPLSRPCRWEAAPADGDSSYGPIGALHRVQEIVPCMGHVPMKGN